MDRSELSVTIIAEMGALFMAELEQVLPQMLGSDLAGIEQQAQACSRRVWGPVVGGVAEAAVQEAMAGVRQGVDPWPDAPQEDDGPSSGVLAVEVDGLCVHCDDGWHEVKQVTVAPLGPEVAWDPDTQRERLVWGQA